MSEGEPLELTAHLAQPVEDGLERIGHVLAAGDAIRADLERLLEQTGKDGLTLGHIGAAHAEELAVDP